jgi:hypothetical protein
MRTLLSVTAILSICGALTCSTILIIMILEFGFTVHTGIFLSATLFFFAVAIKLFRLSRSPKLKNSRLRIVIGVPIVINMSILIGLAGSLTCSLVLAKSGNYEIGERLFSISKLLVPNLKKYPLASLLSEKEISDNRVTIRATISEIYGPFSVEMNQLSL